MDFDALYAYVRSTPLIWIILTLGAYKVGVFLYEKSGKHPLLQPIIIAYFLMLPILIYSDVPYEKYFKSVEILHLFLGPATVALALPLYKNLHYVKMYFFPMLITLFVGGTVTILISLGIFWLLDGSTSTMLAISTKSVTAPITIITSQEIGANPALAVTFVVITGLTGALFSNYIIRFLKVKNDVTIGFVLGLVTHAIGVMISAERNEKTVAFAVLAMGLCGVLTALILPIVVTLLSL